MSEGFRGLRESLLQLGALATDLPRQAPTTSLVAAARDKVADRLGLPDVPTPEQQEALHRRFRRWLDGKAAEPSAEDWALAPFVYFRGRPELCEDPRFARGVAERIDKERLPRVLKRAIYAYLRDFAPDRPSVAQLGGLISRSLAKHHGRWAEDWTGRAGAPRQLFAPEGLASRLAAEVCADAISPRALMRDLGLSAELTAYCGLHRPLAEALATRFNRLASERQVPDAAAVSEIVEFQKEGENLRFPDLRPKLADDLLAPFTDIAADPPDDVRTVLVEYFDRLYGDPRNQPGNWKDVSGVAKAVMLRWMVRKSLDLFFDVLSKTADPIWRYRRAFWLALYRHGLIEDAWPAFGRTAQRHVRANQSIGAKLSSLGELRGAQSEQSVMLMKMRGFVVAEWSHAGACRVWSANDPRSPALGEADYHAVDLRQDCLFAQSHTSAMSGSWQFDLSNWIAQRTGVRVPLSELMANTHA